MNPADLIVVFDEYLKRSGVGKNYIADKIFKLFDDKNSPFNIDGKLVKNLEDNINNFGKKFKSFKLPNFNTFNRAMDGVLKNVRNFRDNFKTPSFNAFNRAMDGMLREGRGFRDNLKVLNKSLSGGLGSLGTEAAVGNPKIIDVRLVDISKDAEDILSRIFGQTKTKNITINQPQSKDKEEGSFIGNLIKGILGTVALVAGIGMLSSFLDTPIGKNIKAIMGNLKDRFIEMLKPFLKKIIDYSIEGLKVLFLELPKYFLKQTFNFFGLKELLGKENEGLAVILTKGIYYGVKNVFIKILDKFSFGMFSKLTKFIRPILDFIPNKLGDIFSKMPNTLGKVFSKISTIVSSLGAIPKAIMQFFSNMGGSGLGKVISSVTKLGSGAIFKLLGAGIKQFAKRIPFIGALISFKDAYDRIKSGDVIGGLISVGSGIASIFPGIGTAISIGLDVLNAFLDNKSEGGKSSKTTVLKDFFGSIVDTVIEKIKGLFGYIIPFVEETFKMLSDLAKAKFEDIKNAISDKAYDTVDSVASSVYSPNYKPPTDAEIQEFKESQKRLKVQKVEDGIITKNKVVVPSSSDDVVMAKNGGPFDLAFREMNAKLDQLSVIFAQGTQLIANSTMQGSSSVVQAVVSTGGKQAPVMIGGSDPIADFRQRANKSVG